MIAREPETDEDDNAIGYAEWRDLIGGIDAILPGDWISGGPLLLRAAYDDDVREEMEIMLRKHMVKAS